MRAHTKFSVIAYLYGAEKVCWGRPRISTLYVIRDLNFEGTA